MWYNIGTYKNIVCIQELKGCTVVIGIGLLKNDLIWFTVELFWNEKNLSRDPAQ